MYKKNHGSDAGETVVGGSEDEGVGDQVVGHHFAKVAANGGRVCETEEGRPE